MSRREWIARSIPPIGGVAVFAASVAEGDRLSLIWLPAVMLASAWPYRRRRPLRNCVRRAGVRRRR
jgi:hypothetical protein